jgi:hypothetical protein
MCLFPFSTNDKRINFQAGWTGYVRKTTYQYLASRIPGCMYLLN